MILLSLSIMMLELAHWGRLYGVQYSRHQRPNKYDTAFSATRRLRSRVSEKMGSRVVNNIGKYVQRDFG